MQRSKIIAIAAAVAIILAVLVVRSCLFVVREWEQVVVTQFGRHVNTYTEPGLKFRWPLIQEVHRFSKRLLPWDGERGRIPTGDKRNIWIDTFARWRIADPRVFFQRVRTKDGGQQRLDGRIDAAVRDVIGRYPLIELVRSTDRELPVPAGLEEGRGDEEKVEIKTGRPAMESQILSAASAGLEETLGIQLIGVRIKRIKYVESVQQSVYERMKAERLRIAKSFRSEALAEQARIRGDTQHQLDIIEGEAYRQATEIMGKADAEATRIYAESVSKAPEFYSFLRALDAYKKALGGKTRLILTTDSEFLDYLKSATPTNRPASD